MENYSNNYASAHFEANGFKPTSSPATPLRSPSSLIPLSPPTPATQESAAAPEDDGHDLLDYEHCEAMEAKTAAAPEDDLLDYEYYEALDAKPAPAKALGQGNESGAAASAEPESEDEPVELRESEYYEELERKQAAKRLLQAQGQSQKPATELAAAQPIPELNPQPAGAHPSLSPFSGDHPPARHNNAYPTPSPSSASPEVDMEYDADGESGADERLSFPGRSFLHHSFLRNRNRLIGNIKIQRQANKAMRNRLRRIGGCKKYESATLKSLEKEWGVLKDEGRDLEMKLGMAQVEALVRMQGARKANGGAGNYK